MAENLWGGVIAVEPMRSDGRAAATVATKTAKAQVSAEHEATAPEAMHSDEEAVCHLASSVGQTLPDDEICTPEKNDFGSAHFGHSGRRGRLHQNTSRLLQEFGDGIGKKKVTAINTV